MHEHPTSRVAMRQSPHAPATDSVRISKGVHGAPCEASACRLAPLGVVSLASHQCGHCGADLPNIPRGNGCVMSRDGVKGYQTFYFRAGATLCNLSVTFGNCPSAHVSRVCHVKRRVPETGVCLFSTLCAQG
jgi:hypothetical protein